MQIVVRKPVRHMEVGDTLVLTKREVNKGAAEVPIKMTKIESILRSRRGEWYKVNDRYIFYPGAYFDTVNY